MTRNRLSYQERTRVQVNGTGYSELTTVVVGTGMKVSGTVETWENTPGIQKPYPAEQNVEKF